MSFYKIVEGLKKVSCDNSPMLYSWNNDVDKNRLHLILSKDVRLISAVSKLIKDGNFFLYKYSPDFLKHRSNVTPIFSTEYLDYPSKQKLGFVILDTNSNIDTKNLLKIFRQYIDCKTIFFTPKIVNFAGYENKVLAGVVGFCEEYGFDIKWRAHCGGVELYDIRDIGYNQGATFSLI